MTLTNVALMLFDRDNDIDECCLDVCFASNFEVLGKLTQHELKPGGAQVLVADENKEEYLKYVCTEFCVFDV